MTGVSCPNCGAALSKGVQAALPTGLTPRQRECLDVILRLTKNGVPPSYAMIMEELGLKSKSGVNRLVKLLVERGHVRNDTGRARSLVIVKAEERPNAIAA
jgi:repressor LexA